jgi:hypothetical protein
VALPGYELPESIKVCTRYSYGYESEMYEDSYYAGFSYDPTTGEIVVQQAPYGADNILVIRADGVAVEGAPGGTHSGIAYTRPDGLYGPFDWVVTDGEGELVASSKQDYYGENINYAAYTPAEPGVSYITATSKDGQYSITFAVICQGIQAESLDLESHNVELNVGETSQLQVSMDPIPTLDADKELIFTSFNPDVATVDENGVITAHKPGYAYIQITCATNNRVMTYCIVYVLGEVEPEGLLGDVNGDGEVNTTDAKLVMQYDLGLIDETGLDLSVADVNGDGAVNTTDAKLIMQLDLGLIDKFPAEN